MTKKDYPDDGELIIGTVVKVQNFGAFVTLDEYEGKEGFVHIAEIATGWVKRIRDHVREKQKIVCRVVHIDRAKQHVDLSLKKVNEHQKREKIQDWKNAQKSNKLLEMVAKKLNKSVEQCYDDFANDLTKKYGTLHAAFEEASYDVETLKKDGFQGDWLKPFEEIAKASIAIPFVDIKGYINVTSWLPDGANHIRDALIKAEESKYEDVEITLKYIGAPKYMITVKAPDYKIAEDEMKKAVDKIKDYIKKYKGDCEFQRKTGE